MAGPRSPRVLVVDDEAAIRDIVRRYLTTEGFEVAEAADGREALHRLGSLEPDLVVLDVLMPGMDGLEVLRRVRAGSDVYVILLTAKAEEVDKLVGLAVGADDYLTSRSVHVSWRHVSERCCVDAATRSVRLPGVTSCASTG